LALTPDASHAQVLIDPVRLSEEPLGDPLQVANQRYVDDSEVHAPSVITLNAMKTLTPSSLIMSPVRRVADESCGHRARSSTHRHLRLCTSLATPRLDNHRPHDHRRRVLNMLLDCRRQR